MKGIQLRMAIKESGRTITEVAGAIGMSQQNLSAALDSKDIKSSIVESVAAYLEMPVSSFYGEGNSASVGGNGTAIAGQGNTVNEGKLIDEIAAQRRLTEQALSQNDRLIGIIDSLTNGKA